MSIKLDKVLGVVTVILLFSTEVFAALDSNTISFWNNYDAPGSFNDPLKALTLYSPSFTIPKLNRFDGIVRGAPQASAGYVVDGISLITFSEISDLFSLSEQSIIPENYSTIVGTRQIFPVSPFFFDGYRSWFSEQNGMDITIDGSYAPVERGFFCGPQIIVDDNQISNEGHIEANATFFESTLNGSFPVGNNFQLFGSVRSGYNRHPVEKWIQPYSWGGDADPGFPFFSNYRIGTIWQPSEKFFLKAHIHGALERRSSTIANSYSSDVPKAFRNYFINNATAEAGWQITDAVISTTNFGFGYGNGESGLSDYFNRTATIGTLTIREKFQFLSMNNISPFIGGDFRKSFGTSEEFFHRVDLTFVRNKISIRQAQFAPFIGITSHPADFISIDGGIRMDKYLQLKNRSSSIFAISPWKALVETTSVDISYRFNTKISLKENFGISFSSGLYNQLPSYFELQQSNNLRSIKSSRHSLCQHGSIPSCKIAYNLEAYFHQFWDMPGAPISNLDYPVFESFVSNGIIKSKGMELSLRYTPISMFAFLVGYGLSWNDQFNIYTNNWIRADSDRRHKLSGLCDLKLPFGLECATGVVFSSGAPYTPVIGYEYASGYFSYVPFYSRINSKSGDNYVNASVRLSYARSFGPISAEIYTEGCNLLQNAPDYGLAFWEGFSNDDIPHNIDQRTIAAGIVIKY